MKRKARELNGLLRCNKCGEYKLPEEFYRNKLNRYGRQFCCKPCQVSGNRQYLKDYYQTHKKGHRSFALASYYRKKKVNNDSPLVS